MGYLQYDHPLVVRLATDVQARGRSIKFMKQFTNASHRWHFGVRAWRANGAGQDRQAQPAVDDAGADRQRDLSGSSLPMIAECGFDQRQHYRRRQYCIFGLGGNVDTECEAAGMTQRLDVQMGFDELELPRHCRPAVLRMGQCGAQADDEVFEQACGEVRLGGVDAFYVGQRVEEERGLDARLHRLQARFHGLPGQPSALKLDRAQTRRLARCLAPLDIARGQESAGNQIVRKQFKAPVAK